MATTAKFRIWRGDSSSGQFVDYSTEVDPGMVVLDAVHHSGDAGERPRGALELQGREVRIVFGRDQRAAAADVHDANERVFA